MLANLGCLLLYNIVNADVYMQSPRGSNNKLNEQQNNVQNDNRLFDSQNNANAGYQVGDACIPNCLSGNTYQRDYPGAGEGVMQYYEGSHLWIDWTNQHGSQSPLLNNQFVLQYMCDDGPYSDGLRDGKTTATIPLNPADPNIQNFGQHENFKWYDECRQRERNRGLYLADQNLQGTTAIYTRQNTNGQRFGYECPEERDYYPYWHPTPWRDIWVCSNTATQCPMYQDNSQNVRNYGYCKNKIYNNEKDCVNNREIWTEGGNWNTFAPNCTVCPRTRNNHNGNAVNDEHSPSYMWQIPEGIHRDGARCILRLRYNITTKDFPGGDSWNVFANSNGQNSPVRNNPTSDFIGLGFNVSGPLRMNLNTQQVIRAFEDRSHVFQIRKRPTDLKCGLKTATNCKIINLNVRGRRGNIQQTYPAVEYDFVPPVVSISKNDYLHIQWTGSDANDQNNAGNGRTGTDRNNMVLISNLGRNYPMNFSPLLQDKRPIHFTNNYTLIAYLAFLNQTGCNDEQTNTNENDNCKTLNRSPAYVNAGLVQMENTGVYHYMSSRNNAFSNREQKATIIVEEDSTTIGAGVGIGVTGVLLLSLGSAFTLRYAKRNPETRLGTMYKVMKSNDALQDNASPSGNDSENELEQEEKEKKTLVEKHPWLASLVEWYAWNQPRILFWTFFISCQSAAWMYGYFLNRINPSPFFGFAKGFGKMLDFSMGFILLCVLRNFLSYLRTTPAADKLPLDDNIRMHKWTGYTILFAASGHIAMHFGNYYWAQTNFAIPMYINIFTNMPGITGVLVTLVMMCMYSTAFLKRKVYSIFGNRFDGYRTFLQVHRLWAPVYVILFLHGAQFWQWAIFPLVFIAIEKYIQSCRVKQDVKIVEAKLVGKDVLQLRMQLLNGKKKFRYKAGQYLFLCCPDINESEFHPFTITSAPEENFFSCHIRCRPDMDWTYSLRRYVLEHKETDGNANVINMEVKSTAPSTPGTPNMGGRSPLNNPHNSGTPTQAAQEYNGIVLRIDGPYGSASEEVFDFDTVVLVGAGIGVTPFISILKSISMRLTQSESAISIYFYWICRDQQEFDSFKDFFDQIMKIKELNGLLELNMYVTGELNLKNVRAEAYNQFSGRPNWNRIFKEMAKRHQGSEIGVFLCGPAALAPTLANACKAHSTKRSKALMKGKQNVRTIFKFHKENF